VCSRENWRKLVLFGSSLLEQVYTLLVFIVANQDIQRIANYFILFPPSSSHSNIENFITEYSLPVDQKSNLLVNWKISIDFQMIRISFSLLRLFPNVFLPATRSMKHETIQHQTLRGFYIAVSFISPLFHAKLFDAFLQPKDLKSSKFQFHEDSAFYTESREANSSLNLLSHPIHQSPENFQLISPSHVHDKLVLLNFKSIIPRPRRRRRSRKLIFIFVQSIRRQILMTSRKFSSPPVRLLKPRTCQLLSLRRMNELKTET
jgi:hypothetical protein